MIYCHVSGKLLLLLSTYLAVLGWIAVAECRGDDNQQSLMLNGRYVVVVHAIDLPWDLECDEKYYSTFKSVASRVYNL